MGGVTLWFHPHLRHRDTALPYRWVPKSETKSSFGYSSFEKVTGRAMRAPTVAEA